jgi:TPR repeat protein
LLCFANAMKKQLLFPLCLILAGLVGLSAGTARSSDFIAARTAYIELDFKEAARLFLELANEGDHRGQSFMGRMHEMGWGVNKDLPESIRWHQLAAKQGNGYSAQKIAMAYWTGEGAQQDPVRAEMWFTIAIQRGFGWADRVSLEKNLTQQQVIRGRDMAGKYMKENNLLYKTKK